MGNVICGSDRSFFLCCLVIADAASLGLRERQIREGCFKVDVVIGSGSRVLFMCDCVCVCVCTRSIIYNDGMKLLSLLARYYEALHLKALVSGSC